MSWTCPAYTRAEAAKLSGIHPQTLDVIIHRNRPIAVLFSSKVKGRRWFSPRDITVLRLAYELERAGRNWLTAIAQAYEHLAQPPPPGALLIIQTMSISARSGRVLMGLPDPIPSESFAVLPIGRIAAEIIERCEQLKEKPVVAVPN